MLQYQNNYYVHGEIAFDQGLDAHGPADTEQKGENMLSNDKQLQENIQENEQTFYSFQTTDQYGDDTLYTLCEQEFDIPKQQIQASRPLMVTNKMPCLQDSNCKDEITSKLSQPCSKSPAKQPIEIDRPLKQLQNTQNMGRVVEYLYYEQFQDPSNPFAQVKHMLQLQVQEDILNDGFCPEQQGNFQEWLDCRTVAIHELILLSVLFDTSPCTRQLAIDYLDTCLLKFNIQNDKQILKLLLLVCFRLACKVEEVDPPSKLEMKRLANPSGLSCRDLVEAEQAVLGVLDFHLYRATRHSFVHVYSLAAGVQLCYRTEPGQDSCTLNATRMQQLQELSLFILDFAALNWGFSFERPSKIAAAAVCLARSILTWHWSKQTTIDPWDETLKTYTRYELHEIAELVEQMLYSLQAARNMSCEGNSSSNSVLKLSKHIHAHYSDPKRCNVSSLPVPPVYVFPFAQISGNSRQCVTC